MEGPSTRTHSVKLLFPPSFLQRDLGGCCAPPQPCPLLLSHLPITLFRSCSGLEQQQPDPAQHSHHPSRMTGIRDLE